MKKAQKMSMKLTPGVNFINVLCAAFASVAQKSVKNTFKSSVFLHFQDLQAQKLCVNMLVKLTPVLFSEFLPENDEKY